MSDKKETSRKNETEDTQIIQSFLKGEKKAFDRLVIRHKDKIFNLCCWFLQDYHEANDSAQEIFIKVFCSIEKFRFESSFSTWLYRIAINTCKNKLNSLEYRFKKKMKQMDHPFLNDTGIPPGEIADEMASPMVQLEKKERKMRITRAINSLSNAKKTVIILRDVEEFSYKEISHITGYNLGTVKSKIARARLDLRKKLKIFDK